MLPSTGYFKTINCPFYESGSCDRPYCHFKHARKDDTTNILGLSTPETTETVQAKINENVGTNLVATPDSDALQKLVTETVKKILATQEVSDTDKISENIVTKVVEELKPTLASASLASSSTVPEPPLTNEELGKHTGVPSSISKCVYNPTPIAELKKRHIPIASYIPTRESKVSVKRKISPDRSKSLLSFIHGSDNNYSSNELYKPTSIGAVDTASIPSYVPTTKSDSSPANSYDDSNSSEYCPRKSKEQYFPKVKKRREEYVPRRIKHPLKTVQQLEESIEEDTVLEFARKFETIDNLLLEEKTDIDPTNEEESHDYESLDPKFSDDESEDDNLIALINQVEDLESKVENLEEKENTDIELFDKKEETTVATSHKSSSKSSRKEHSSSSSSSKPQSTDTKREKSRSEKSHVSKHDEKKRDEGKSRDKISKSGVTKDKHSSSKSKERSSSSGGSKDRSKEKDAHREREKDRSSERSKSSKDGKNKDNKDSKDNKESKESKDLKSKSKKDYKSDKEKEGSRDSKQDKHKSDKHKTKSKSSSSSSRKDKHKSHKSDEKHHSSHKSNSSNHKHSSSSKKLKSKRDKSDDDDDRDFGSEIEGMHNSFENEEAMEISDSDHDVEEECFKIFQEYEVADHSKDVTKKQSHKRHIKEVEDVEDVVVKKRIAYPSATSMSSQLPERKEPKKVVNPHQKLYDRWRLLKAAAAAATSTLDKNDEYVPEQIKPTSSKYISETSIEPSSSYKNESQLNGNGRIRIAHVPYAMSLALEKKKVLEIASNAVTKTAAQTAKTGSRVAHVPVVIPQLIRPEPIQVSTQKFPPNVRQHYVNMMQDICVQIYTNGDDAVNRATREEFACHERCKALPVYKNSCMLAAHRLRKEVDQGTDTSSMSSASGIVSHEAVLAGKSRGSWSVIKSKKSVADLHGANLYYMLSKWILTDQQLKDNGFPRPHPDGPRGRAKVYVINTRNHSIISKVPNERFCSRCNQPYIIDRFGFPVKQENCIYHYGRKFTFRGEGKYSCCQQDSSASGCCDAKSHVWEYVDVENLRGYVTTLPKESDLPPEEQGVYALDCEMCYTTEGLELTRVTVINEDCQVVYETLVKPEHPILDYNTRFSGITEENMRDVSTTLLDVQATLLTLFSDKTILIGHSLESDFKALKLIHDTVVDTSVMFPHRNGYPQKRALKNLCSEYLRKIIQNDVGGHDSNEDAMACMELVLWKVKEEAKLI
ncbi:RNA exonuclease 1 homolog isoform X2 [Leptopilina heterotoma]|uniref:RNA exonuclease 1 homolog isoform X2 n=1 Tax=Leptopilina heterotoma TaxID=63436 RepID=UPI001CA86157|nr:RNA exonuclease 1 homolog isoform X2 [Leptopilina heterotoma]